MNKEGIKKKVLIICPIVPYPENGAEQSDRANGIRQLLRLGFDVRVIAKRRKYQSDIDVENFIRSVGNIKVKTVIYKYTLSENSFFNKIKLIFRRILNPKYYDGAAFEYFDQEFQEAVRDEIENWKPDILWSEYTYLWPVFHLAKKKGISIVTRSINFEPRHFLDEDGRSIFNLIKSIPKYISEYKVVKNSDLIFSITPKEKEIYSRFGSKAVEVLPLRGLHLLEWHIVHEDSLNNKNFFNLYFMGSTYNVSHNKEAADFVIKKLAPEIYKNFGNDFIINILGAKLPNDLISALPSNVRYCGFVQDLNEFLNNMDIAVIPSLYGAGMQQKIFEPLMRGFPTIASSRGLAGYNFEINKEILIADSIEQYIEKLRYLKANTYKLKEIGNNARLKAMKLFSSDVIDKIVSDSLNKRLGI